MHRLARTPALLCILCATAVSQPANPTTFTLADVHVSPHSNSPSVRGGGIRNGRYELRSATMVDLIARAWGVDNASVLSGPAWLETDRFDVIASVPATATPEALQPMLQALLADRFRLAVHHDSKPVQAWVLTAGKHPLIKQSDSSDDGGCRRDPAESIVINGVMSCHNATMQQFVDMLEIPYGPVTSYLGNYPVRDLTELKGSWDFTMKWTGRGGLANAGSEGVTLFDAVEKQLGLRLELKPTPLPVIVVDSVNRIPTGNAPGISREMPELPTRFDVAEIKLSNLDAPVRARFQPGGRYTVRGVTLLGLIKHAWSLDRYDDMIVNAPKWMESDRVDVIAKAAGPEGPSGVLKDDDTLKLMLRQLIEDSFKMVVHTEEQPVTVYALVPANPKLKKADPANRTGCRYTGAKGAGQVASQLSAWNCQNMSTAQLADWLPQVVQAQAWLDHPVVDETGMEGSWDFSLTFSTPSAFQAHTALDPNGALSLFEAMEKQLGLRLQTRKHPMPVLVIDHIEQTPTGN
ncbi:MAG TPA: TIGR03435 family protein [Bryobacteraceae bacterium]|nr:TIGR03435 family protein [Bryobacteraceae bacterium]